MRYLLIFLLIALPAEAGIGYRQDTYRESSYQRWQDYKPAQHGVKYREALKDLCWRAGYMEFKATDKPGEFKFKAAESKQYRVDFAAGPTLHMKEDTEIVIVNCQAIEDSKPDNERQTSMQENKSAGRDPENTYLVYSNKPVTVDLGMGCAKAKFTSMIVKYDPDNRHIEVLDTDLKDIKVFGVLGIPVKDFLCKRGGWEIGY